MDVVNLLLTQPTQMYLYYYSHLEFSVSQQPAAIELINVPARVYLFMCKEWAVQYNSRVSGVKHRISRWINHRELKLPCNYKIVSINYHSNESNVSPFPIFLQTKMTNHQHQQPLRRDHRIRWQPHRPGGASVPPSRPIQSYSVPPTA